MNKGKAEGEPWARPIPMDSASIVEGWDRSRNLCLKKEHSTESPQ